MAKSAPDGPHVSLKNLHAFASDRCGIVENAMRSDQDPFLTRQNLITNTLRFAEAVLNGWVAGTHFELCVFVDQFEPLLFAYFDSNRNTMSRSMNERERNPQFYVQKEYEVTRLLKSPTSQPRILDDTHDLQTKYSFISDNQRKQLRSSILLCLDLASPCALVMSSNTAGAFIEGDVELITFVRYVGEVVRYDLIQNAFVSRIREYKPTLFSAR